MTKNWDVWLNGFHLGYHGYGWSPIWLDLTPALNETGPNVLAVKVNCTGPDSAESQYRGAGINRHVVLQAMGPVHVTTWGPFISTRRLGGLEHWRASAAFAGAHHLPVLPHYYKEYDVPLAMTVPNVLGVEWLDWVDPLLTVPVRTQDGFACPNDGSGWGFQFKDEHLVAL